MRAAGIWETTFDGLPLVPLPDIPDDAIPF